MKTIPLRTRADKTRPGGSCISLNPRCFFQQVQNQVSTRPSDSHDGKFLFTLFLSAGSHNVNVKKNGKMPKQVNNTPYPGKFLIITN